MQYLNHHGVRLAYEEAGRGAPPLVFLHGITCDHSHFGPQFHYFRQNHRVVTVDLRGHGESDKPEEDYSLSLYTGDLAWLCEALGLYRPVIVGHSLGGVIALDLAARYPELPGAIVLLDAPVVVPAGVEAFIGPVTAALRTPDYLGALRQFMAMNFHPADDQARKAQILEAMARVPQQVIRSTWDSVFSTDTDALARACQVPILYIDAGPPNCDLARFQQLCPQLMVGKTVGSGHWHQLEVPAQVNGMIERFLTIVLQPEVILHGTAS